jgi:hypothetical protein
MESKSTSEKKEELKKMAERHIIITLQYNRKVGAAQVHIP